MRETGHRSGVPNYCRAKRILPGLIIATIVQTCLVAFAPGHLAGHAAASPPPPVASTDLSAICDQAASFAAQQTGVPISVLKAISLTETGRKKNGAFRPWPWTVNMEGKGVWFDGPEEAQAYVDKNFARGARSFDVGCFQINYKWHGQHFASIAEMFEPHANAIYAAEFLQRLFDELGSWSAAAGAYHSRTPKYADKYRARFDTFRAKFAAEDNAPIDVPALAMAELMNGAPKAATPRVNHFPLLLAGVRPAALGSLVPLDASNRQVRLIAVHN